MTNNNVLRLPAFSLTCSPVALCSPTSSTTSSSSTSTSSNTCNRRQFFNFSAATLLSLAVSSSLAPTVANAESPPTEKPLRQFDSLQEIESVVADTLPLDKFVQQIDAAVIKQVWFFGNLNQHCFYEVNDGSIYRIGEGYPKEQAKSNESPLQVMARVRNRRIPYSVHPIPLSFLRKQAE